MIVADIGPVVAFSLISRLDIVKKLLGTLNVSPAGAEEARRMIRELSSEAPTPTEEYLEVSFVDVTAAALSLPESEALQVAREQKAQLLLTDDVIVRQEARNSQVAVLGTVGLLHAASQRGLVDNVAAVLDRLGEAGYTFSESCRAALVDRAEPGQQQ